VRTVSGTRAGGTTGTISILRKSDLEKGEHARIEIRLPGESIAPLS
jgi:hypothetical protein